jgi:phenylacetate-CoA ligase
LASSLAQRLYWNAPYGLKCRLASWNAWRLDRQRYGPAYRRHLESIAEHDRWAANRFAEFQEAALVELVRQAGERVPYYRRLFETTGIDAGQFNGLADLPRLPILQKETLRVDPMSLVDETLDRAQLIVLHTSGTTGTPLELYRDASLNAAAFAYLDARWHAVVGVRRREQTSVSIGGHLVAEPARSRPPFWVENRRWRQLYMSSYHLSPKNLGAYVTAIRGFGCDYIEGYPSSVYAVARHMIDHGLEPVPMKACFTTAETLFDYQREAIQQAFNCRTYNQYGCGEMCVFAAECEQGSMHLSPEFGIVEVLDENDQPVAPGATGQLVCTSLINRIQPFIRYRLGDMGSLRPGKCACGSPLPMMGDVEGRTDAVLVTRDGRRIGRLDTVFKGGRHIVEAQVVQDDLDTFRLRLVPAAGYAAPDGARVAHNLRQRLGGGTVRIELVESIARTRAGKFPAVISGLSRPRAN